MLEETRLKLSDTVFPELDKSDSWSNENNKAIRDLFRCIESGNCVENQEKVVILGSFHFRGALTGWVGGEDICLNYTLLYSLNNDRAVQLYQMFPALVVAVLFESSDVVVCYRDNENCLQSERNPHGIPIYKLFSWHFWSQPAHPLGSQWTWQPEPYAIEGYFPDVTYVGYSVEPSCSKQPFIPHEGRQAYLLAKHLYYFTDEIAHGWSSTVWKRVKEETGIELIIGSRGDDDYEQPEGLTNLGFMPQERFLNEVAKSRVLIGVGQPYTSPTPYEALCLGVPFINPILQWDPENPLDKSRWDSQHVILRYLDPPYVYNVQKDDEQGLIDAINAAYENPIDSFVLDRMRIPSIAERLEELLGRDWEELAKNVPLNPMDGW
ncbi:uncharacterized protein STEHIDRAFT_96739 [Stereum hirsutum FP-91666 SS1]|uniref:uncharacterized protein n=1 Tax=Stereum hirsutum (strain FP-91666) TaxID=721885 RepID=UPI000440DD5E|nr:uncharacterized protein STEHIDRAFT_96739 [Stereum hirsutum FP-91666 SS1]EIM87562.1 hypothetical protein STEHIDRAFT_96739 [Stereum hirsutum FP-91666 SS1]